MAENINGSNILSSGGHQWMWGDAPRAEKVLSSVGFHGVFSYVVSAGGRPGVIVGELRGTGISLAASHAALTALEAVIEALCLGGREVAWGDPEGRSGSYLVVVRYRRAGPRGHNVAGTAAWQRYALEIRNNLS